MAVLSSKITVAIPLKCDCHGHRVMAMHYGDKIVIKDGEHTLTIKLSHLST